MTIQALAQVLAYGRQDAVSLLKCTKGDARKALLLGLQTLRLDVSLLHTTLLAYAAARLVCFFGGGRGMVV